MTFVNANSQCRQIGSGLALMIIVFSTLIAFASTDTDYCAICSDHTMCLYSGVAAKCQTSKTSNGVTPTEQATVVDIHNNLRNQVAAGRESQGAPGPQPSAANMMILAWDTELATVAQRWADQCNYKHDTCRNVPRFYVGQNIAISLSSTCSAAADFAAEWNRTISSWYNEVQSMDKAQVPSFTGAGGVGHYTQIIWANTSLVGCGYRLFQEGSNCRKFYVCNYGKGGNWNGQSIYTAGTARSQCPSSTAANSKYPSLC